MESRISNCFLFYNEFIIYVKIDCPSLSPTMPPCTFRQVCQKDLTESKHQNANIKPYFFVQNTRGMKGLGVGTVFVGKDPRYFIKATI